MNAADKQRYLALNIKDFTKDLLEIDSEPLLEYNDCYNNNICGLMQTNGQCPFGYSPLGSDFFKTDRLDLYDYISNRTKVRTDYEVKILKAEMEDVCRKYEPYLRCRGDWATKSKIVDEVMDMFPHAPTSPTPAQDGTDEVVLPDELNTPRAQKAFANAIKAGYIERTATGYVWTNNKPSQLAYFLYVVYCPTQQEEYQETAFNKLFGVTRLLANLTQVLNAKQPQRWRQDIIKLIE